MPLALHYLLWTPPTVVLFLGLASDRRKPIADLSTTLLALRRPAGRRVLALLLLTLVCAIAEAVLDPHISALLGYDLSTTARVIEGDFVERIQRSVRDGWLPVMCWFYLFGFAAFQVLPFFIWTPREDWAAVRRYCFCYSSTLALAVPFYLFVPVKEVAWSGASNAVAMLDVWWPGLSDQTRMGSGLNNCFPSLHVGLTAMTWIVTREHGPRSYARFSLVVALITSWLVMALGIHWLVDVISGWLHAIGACWFARHAQNWWTHYSASQRAAGRAK